MSFQKNEYSHKNVSEDNNGQGGNPPITSPLNDQQISSLQQTVSELSSQQLAWVSGYFWGLAQNQPNTAVTPIAQATAAVSAKPAGKLSIIFASQTGNAKGVAEALEQEAKAEGIAVELFDASDYKGKNLAKETHVIIVASTNGEGEAPDNAIELHEFLQSKKAPKLPNLQYGVIALGDSSYEFFCQTGKDFDTYLSKLGATPFIERLDCDVDYEAPATEWRKNALDKVKDTLSSGSEADVVQLPVGQAATAHSPYNKQNPYTATLLTSQKITGRDSGKDVRHIEIDLEGSGLTYQPGDALGVWFENSSELANAILGKVGLSGVETVDVDGESLSIHSALVSKCEITTSNPQLITKFAELSGSKKLQKLVEDKDKLREYSANTQIVDVLAEKKTKLTADELIGLLRRLTPRLYSIASSQEEVDEEVHLTVALVEYEQNDEKRYGGASSFLAQRLEEGDEVKVFVEHNNNFKLPEDDSTPIIMVGPGTGIAPFRSFIQERENRDSEGKNWLFFGDRTFTQDFLYQVEWQKYLKSGVLSRLDVAFSRDQVEKVYVQHRILENAAQVWQWIQEGAYIYVCGDATRMAKDVHDALVIVAEQEGKMPRDDAEQFINDLRKAKRYQRDVY
ncbi:assimilatory sulfite reductase (NADPH) flavoprotein subunit [Vibrio alginolyticus]|uniref:assimilatory sulfite reductase (NADPH) flavoprotein subunit n=1 Tax=Vibrio alginolyticus TaxID=663 RepID=UPI001EB3774D|nr:assimilatory sulfite reductase (NADPH) flavoprotein subunit [Vibrio alginolyticus]EGR0722989.1 assimilatory sulfite reductase (NADPH) flavoprotein subunit [Vibrio alginolyticus]ELA7328334.1 assimilatory sulfite reductase (NADPH) flavoprotein subunit [Vibrio alginolyticus]ELB1641987.1 assimilatory sulfite reductase (NADPH) flavoprotein subunit [Vibrio alginolyticus]MCR9374348.1 assimilatory sulfite reductase (NADPH) flavoprotein subunit [Vibrio alginolyticus]MCR9410504.1 assimilatory sulfite